MHNKSDVITIAGNLFSQRGYHGTTMRELARSLDLRGASLYSHISSKEEMLWEIVRRAADEFLAYARDISTDLSIETQMLCLIRGHLSVIANELPYATVFFQEWKFLESELRDKITALRDEYEGYFRRVIEEGTRRGIFQVKDTRLATLFVLSSLNWTYQWFRPDGSLTIEQLANQYSVFILRSLKCGEIGETL